MLIFYPTGARFVGRAFADRRLLSFGANLVSISIIVYLWFNMNVFVLGKIDIDALGLYGLAFLWGSTPADISSSTISRVMLPTYSSLVRDGRPVFSGYMKTLRFLFVVSFGVFAFLVPIPLLIRPVLGRALVYVGSWQPIIAPVAMLAVIVAGALAYLVCRPGRFRVTESFVGGV